MLLNFLTGKGMCLTFDISKQKDIYNIIYKELFII